MNRQRAIHSTAAGEMVDALRVHGRVDERGAQGMDGEEGGWSEEGEEVVEKVC